MRERRLPFRLSVLDAFLIMVGIVFMASTVLGLVTSARIQQSNHQALEATQQTLKELRAAVAYPATAKGQAATAITLNQLADEIVSRIAKQPTRVIVVEGKTRTIVIERTRMICRLPNGKPC